MTAQTEKSISEILADLGVTHERDSNSVGTGQHRLYYAGRFTLWNRIRKLEHDNNQAAARIVHLEADLEECRAYLEKEMDVVDGSYGEPSPNRAMQLVSMIDESLHGPGAF